MYNKEKLNFLKYWSPLKKKNVVKKMQKTHKWRENSSKASCVTMKGLHAYINMFT